MGNHTSLPRVAWIATGGTIQAIGHDRFHFDGYANTGKSFHPSEILQIVPEITDIVDVQIIDALRMPSHNISEGELLNLAQLVREISDTASYDAVVLTCGTNGLEEIAFFLSLFHQFDVPLVLTASMRPPMTIGTDALLNLVDAFRVAARPETATHGPVIVMNRTIMTPSRAYKGHTHAVDSFRTAGPIGSIGALNDVHYPWLARTQKAKFNLNLVIAPLPRVDIIISHIGADSTMVSASVAAGASGIVSAGFGAGLVTEQEMEALQLAAAKGVIVCQSRRTPDGQVLSADPSFITSGDLTPQKARLILAAGLAQGMSPIKLQDLFSQFHTH